MSDLLLLAAAPSDGWALVREGERHWLVRPPYRQQDRDRLSAVQAARAMAEDDFERAEKSFSGWGSLTRHLEEFRVQNTSAEEREQARGAAARLLTHATADQARRHLTRIGGALDNGHRRGVREALLALLKAESVSSDRELVETVAQFLGRLNSDVPSVRAPPPQVRWRVSDEAGTHAQGRQIREQGTVLGFPSRAA